MKESDIKEYEIFKANTGSTKTLSEFKKLLKKSDKYSVLI